MALVENLMCFGSQENFDEHLASGKVSDRSIAFIKDTGKIWTHGTYFSSLAELESALKEMENVISALEGYLPLTGGKVTGDVEVTGSLNLSGNSKKHDLGAYPTFTSSVQATVNLGTYSSINLTGGYCKITVSGEGSHIELPSGVRLI